MIEGILGRFLNLVRVREIAEAPSRCSQPEFHLLPGNLEVLCPKKDIHSACTRLGRDVRNTTLITQRLS